MTTTLANFFGIAVLYMVIVVFITTGFFPTILKLTQEEKINLKKGFKKGLSRVYLYKWNIVLFAFVASFLLVLPEFQIDWLGELSINEIMSIVFITLGTVSTLLSKLPPLGP